MKALTLAEVDTLALDPALWLLPHSLNTPQARVILHAIGLQESMYTYRCQALAGGGRGPARGFWQFELGTQRSKGGVWGVVLHPASKGLLAELCKARGVPFDAPYIWEALETDDVLAAGVARLLMLTDPLKLPAVTDVEGAWVMYAHRCWRPGKPHKDVWPFNHAKAVEHVIGSSQ